MAWVSRWSVTPRGSSEWLHVCSHIVFWSSVCFLDLKYVWKYTFMLIHIKHESWVSSTGRYWRSSLLCKTICVAAPSAMVFLAWQKLMYDIWKSTDSLKDAENSDSNHCCTFIVCSWCWFSPTYVKLFHQYSLINVLWSSSVVKWLDMSTCGVWTVSIWITMNSMAIKLKLPSHFLNFIFTSELMIWFRFWILLQKCAY